MAKPEWGAKRTCQSCGARFYDLQRTPIICPKCGSNVEPEVIFKPRRQSAAALAAAAAAEAKLVPAAVVEIENDEVEVPDEETEIDAIDGGDDDESGLIEDASDLGEDDDDMAEVMEHIDEGLGDEV